MNNKEKIWNAFN